MAEYLTTKEVAKYLKLNEKKVYALVAEGKMPAARISGKWLFPKHLIDKWVEQSTIYPASSVLSSALDEMIVIQGSDDWLFSKIIKHFQEKRTFPIVSSKVGSVAGLMAVGEGKAHLAAFHSEDPNIQKIACRNGGCYFISLFQREQGIIYNKAEDPEISSIEHISRPGFRLAVRQPLSGTQTLTESMFKRQGLRMDGIVPVGPFSSHLELALAVQKGRADAGIGIKVVADLCALDFIPLQKETFKLAVPMNFASHPQIVGFIEFVLDEVRAMSVEKRTCSYKFEHLGEMDAVGKSTLFVQA
ncbi:MAG: helix-turn-helix transcriptional regulator [Proteobacteria bacterium]|nr:helix-turn-helix transcriptional regulator [Pseudomonadota bacterium]